MLIAWGYCSFSSLANNQQIGYIFFQEKNYWWTRARESFSNRYISEELAKVLKIWFPVNSEDDNFLYQLMQGDVIKQKKILPFGGMHFWARLLHTLLPEQLPGPGGSFLCFEPTPLKMVSGTPSSLPVLLLLVLLLSSICAKTAQMPKSSRKQIIKSAVDRMTRDVSARLLKQTTHSVSGCII